MKTPWRATDRQRGLVAGASLALAAQVATIGAASIMSVIIARMFGPSGTGTVALLTNLLAALTLVGAFGLPTGITYVVSRGQWAARTAYRQSQLLALGLGIVGFATGLAFVAATKTSVFHGVTWKMALLVLAGVPFSLSWTFLGSLALAESLYVPYAVLSFSRAFFSLVLSAAGAIGFGLVGAVAGIALAQPLAAVYSSLVLTRRLRRDGVGAEAQAPSPPGLRQASSFGLKAWSADLLQFLNYRLDLFLLGAFGTQAAVGHYSIAVSLTTLAWLAPSAVQQVLLPRAASLHKAASAGTISLVEADHAAARAIRHTVVLQAPTALGLVTVLAVGVPVIYGSTFQQSILLGLLLLPGVVILGVGKVVSAVVTGRGKPVYSLYAGLITVPVTVALYALLIPSSGAVGAAIASSISYTLSTVLALVFLARVSSLPVHEMLLPTRTELKEYRRAVTSVAARLRRKRGGMYGPGHQTPSGPLE